MDKGDNMSDSPATIAPPPNPPTTPTKQTVKPPVFSSRRALVSPSFMASHSGTVVVKEVSLASGCELIVRGIPAPPCGKSVETLQNAIDDLRNSNEVLHGIPLEIRPYPTRGSDWTSTCYLRLDAQFKPKSLSGAGAEPRCDLLDLWRVAISEAHKEWEVAWTPTVHGTDKRMWVRFPDVREDDSRPSGQQRETMDKILAWAKAANSPVCSSFMNKGGVVLSLASPAHVDTILAAKEVNVPGVAQALKVTRGRQIEILNAFELVIMGATDEFEGIEALLEAWLTENFASEGESTLAGTRVPSHESEAFVFHMTTWDATSKVLSPAAAELFARDFSKYKSLVAPQSVYSLNNKGLWRRTSVREEFVKGSDSMNEGLKAIHRRIDLMQKENRQNNEATQLQLTTLMTNMNQMSSSVSLLGKAVMDTQRAVLLQSAEIGYSRNLSDLQTACLMAKTKAMMTFDAAERLKFEHITAQLEQQEANLRAKIEEGTNGFQNLMGGPVGQQLIAPTAPPGLAPPVIPIPAPRPANRSENANESSLAPNKRPRLSSPSSKSANVPPSNNANMVIDAGLVNAHDSDKHS